VLLKIDRKRTDRAAVTRYAIDEMAKRKSTPIETVTRKPQQEKDVAEAGQSGDLEGLPDQEDVDSESVRELAEEGQYYEASLVDSIENPPPSEAPLRPRHRREDDLAREYPEPDPDEPKE
jgi:hypothetical protein